MKKKCMKSEKLQKLALLGLTSSALLSNGMLNAENEKNSLGNGDEASELLGFNGVQDARDFGNYFAGASCGGQASAPSGCQSVSRGGCQNVHRPVQGCQAASHAGCQNVQRPVQMGCQATSHAGCQNVQRPVQMGCQATSHAGCQNVQRPVQASCQAAGRPVSQPASHGCQNMQKPAQPQSGCHNMQKPAPAEKSHPVEMKGNQAAWSQPAHSQNGCGARMYATESPVQGQPMQQPGTAPQGQQQTPWEAQGKGAQQVYSSPNRNSPNRNRYIGDATPAGNINQPTHTNPHPSQAPQNKPGLQEQAYRDIPYYNPNASIADADKAGVKKGGLTETTIMPHLNIQGKAAFQGMSAEGKKLALKLANQECKGHNECKGLNSCRDKEHACAGQGGCEGKGACNFKDKNVAVKVAAQKMAEKRGEALKR